MKNKKWIAMLTLLCFVLTLMPIAAFAETKYSVTIKTTVDEYGTTTNEGGSINGAGSYQADATVTLTATPQEGYCAIGWAAMDGPTADSNRLTLKGFPLQVGTDMTISFTMPRHDVYITGSFHGHKYTAYTASEDGSSHDVHCYYCKTVQAASEPHVDVTTHPGYEGADGFCDKCQARIPDKYILKFTSKHNNTDGHDYYQILDVNSANTNLPQNRFTLEGYTFQGWSANEDGSGTLYQPGDTYNAVADATFYAVWKVNAPAAYTVTFNTNGGSISPSTATVQPGTIISYMNQNYKPSRSGYNFLGWSLEQDGIASDDIDLSLTTDCTLYAVWQQYSPSYDDAYYDPPPASIPVDVGGDYDAILRDNVVIVRGDAPISGTLDLGKTDAVAIQLPADAVKASAAEGNSVTIRYPGGTSALITGSGLVAAGDALRSGESLQIAVRPVDAAALPDSLTMQPEEDGPYGGRDWAIDKSIFKTTGIENIEDRLNALGLINGNTDQSITEDEFEYLYHYLTTDELMALRNELSESAHFEHHQKAVDWLDEMIERDATVVEMSNGQLNISGILSKLEEIGYTGGDLTLGFLRQADLDMEQLEYIKNLMQEFIEVFDDSADELVLAWAEEAIAQKELEASYAQMDSLIEEARSTNGSYTGLNDVKDAAKDMTTDELERFLAKAGATKNSDSGTLPVLALGALDKIIEYLNSELEARQAQEDTQDAPTYINVGGERTVFVGAIEADVKAVKVSGSTRNIEILADRSNAVAWSTNISSAALEEMLASAGKTATGATAATAVRAYKVLDNGGLEAKAAKVTVNADGTLTASALSNGNSTYIFVLEPNPYTDVNENDWYYNDVMTADQQLLMTGTSDNTFSPDGATTRGMIATILHRMEGSPKVSYNGALNDVPANAYYANAVKWAASTGVLNGYGDGKFGAEDPITREQLAAILRNYAVYKGCDVSVGEDTNILSYNDFDKISEYAISSMQWACGTGIIGGRDGGMLAPQGNAKRCEVAAMLNRYVNWIEEAE